MPIQRSISRFLLIALVAFSVVGLRQVAAQGPNLLTNPGFEGAYVAVPGDTQRSVAPGWTPWNVPKRDNDPGYVLVPQYRNAQTAVIKRIKSGSGAQELFEVYAVFTGGVYQQVQVTPGARLHFSANISALSSVSPDSAQSTQPGRVNLQVGIDPKGGTNGDSSDVVYSSEQQYYDQFHELAIEAVAASSKITVFVRVAALDPVPSNHFYIDDAALTVVAAPVGPIAGITAQATLPGNTPIVITATPSPTLVPPVIVTATPSYTPIVVTVTPVPMTPTQFVIAPLTTSAATSSAATTFTSTVGAVSPDLTGHIVYVVRFGDTVTGLALRFNSTVSAIIAANGLNQYGFIFVGQQLLIPVPGITATATVTTIPATPTLPSGTEEATTSATNGAVSGPTNGGIGTYILQPGDTLSTVAKRFNITVTALSMLNGIVNPNQVLIGQVLAVPGAGNNLPGYNPGGYPNGGAMATHYPPPGGNPHTYIVQPGDDLYRIAQHFNVSVDALLQANGLLNANFVYAGQVLVIP